MALDEPVRDFESKDLCSPSEESVQDLWAPEEYAESCSLVVV